MTTEPTETGQALTDSAEQRGQLSQSSAATDAATRKVFRNELTACLTLVVPTGMTEEERRDWLAFAWQRLRHIPPDIFKIGAYKARGVCDHPAKIVPTIIEETADMMRWRQEAVAAREEVPALPRPDYVSADEAADILKKFGLKK